MVPAPSLLLALWLWCVGVHSPTCVSLCVCLCVRAASAEYFQTMPWKAIPFGHPAIDELSSFFEIEGYPTLLLVNPATGKVLLSDGVQRVTVSGHVPATCVRRCASGGARG